MTAPRGMRLYATVVVCTFFWGGAFIAGRVVAQHLPPMTAAALRFWIARSGGVQARLTIKQLALTAVLGLFGVFLYNVCFFGALARIPAGRASLFMALNPLMTAALGAIVFGETLTRTKWAAFAISVTGVVVILTQGRVTTAQGPLGTGDALMLCAPLCWAACS